MNKQGLEARIKQLESELEEAATALVRDAIQAIDGDLGTLDYAWDWSANIEEGHRIWRDVLGWSKRRIRQERREILANCGLVRWSWPEI